MLTAWCSQLPADRKEEINHVILPHPWIKLRSYNGRIEYQTRGLCTSYYMSIHTIESESLWPWDLPYTAGQLGSFPRSLAHSDPKGPGNKPTVNVPPCSTSLKGDSTQLGSLSRNLQFRAAVCIPLETLPDLLVATLWNRPPYSPSSLIGSLPMLIHEYQSITQLEAQTQFHIKMYSFRCYPSSTGEPQVSTSWYYLKEPHT